MSYLILKQEQVTCKSSAPYCMYLSYWFIRPKRNVFITALIHLLHLHSLSLLVPRTHHDFVDEIIILKVAI